MSANGTRSIIWAGGEDQFCLAKVGLILDLEAKCEAGIATVMTRLGSGTWRLNDVREPIRLGLIGGGMAPDKAMQAVRNHVDGNPLTSSVLLAYAILEAVMVGVPDDPVGKKPDGDDQGKAEPAEAQQTGSITTTDASDAPN
ncbi:gene transfer agent family protein [Bradyrhizobium sp. 147]|uniref:gene transfer agent family protein n=1 Tax=Bradyrhizobium sp. 147 TaxID=2782623 RepID=UPI001FF7D0A6|nr:gene transfer agent family protein [Bradyrhizobium sp. 147]MCK1684243.1 gene transfer agent family protein [Bradyrhizobium sp. 147]